MKGINAVVALFFWFIGLFAGIYIGINQERNRIMEYSEEIVEKHFIANTKKWCEESKKNRLICEMLYCGDVKE